MYLYICTYYINIHVCYTVYSKQITSFFQVRMRVRQTKKGYVFSHTHSHTLSLYHSQTLTHTAVSKCVRESESEKKDY